VSAAQKGTWEGAARGLAAIMNADPKGGGRWQCSARTFPKWSARNVEIAAGELGRWSADAPSDVPAEPLWRECLDQICSRDPWVFEGTPFSGADGAQELARRVRRIQAEQE